MSGHSSIDDDIPNDDWINVLPLVYTIFLYVDLTPILSHTSPIVITIRFNHNILGILSDCDSSVMSLNWGKTI